MANGASRRPGVNVVKTDFSSILAGFQPAVSFLGLPSMGPKTEKD